MKAFIKKHQNIWLCALSGLLLALAYTVTALWWLCLVALVPFCVAMLKEKQTKRRIFKLTYVFCFFYYFPLLLWFLEISSVIAPVTGEAMGILVMLLADIAVATIMALAHGLAMVFFSHIFRGKIWDALTLPVLYVLGELLISLMGDLAFPWGRLANIAIPCLPFVQSAALLGGLFVSLIIMLINALLAFGLLSLRAAQYRKAIACAVATLCLLTANLTGGLVRMRAEEPVADTSVLLVQGNFPSNDKWSTSITEMFSVYLSLSKENLQPETTLVIWPETALPVDLEENSTYKKQLQAFTAETGTTLVIGATEYQDGNHYNVMVLIFPDGTVSPTYRKQLLVPMGEYTPLSEVMGIIFPGILEGVTGRELAHGREMQTYETEYGTLNGIICYESIAPAIQREATVLGSGLITMITNDSWFGTSVALRQHFSHAQMRAVENGRYLARAGNSGITAVVSPLGTVTASLPTYQRGTLACDVGFCYGRTLYSLIGDIWLVLLAVPCIILAFSDIIRLIKGKKCKTDKINPAK